MMKKFTDHIDTSDGLFIQRYGHGVKLVTDDVAQRSHIADIYRVSNIFSLPMSIYLLDSISTIKRVNESMAEICNCDSPAELINKTVARFSPKKDAQRVIDNDQTVIKSGNANIFNEDVMLNHGVFISALSGKMPLYNHENRIIGIFGYGIILGKHNLSESLKKMMSLGLLSHSHQEPSVKYKLAKLSQRQLDCIAHFVAGSTLQETAEQLSISPRTVEHYLEEIKAKLGCNKKSEVIKFALKYIPK